LINIVDLIIIGRKIYKRIVLWIINKIVKTFQIVFFIVIASLIYKKPIITPTQMILILLLYDFVTMSIATDNVIPNKKPERWNLKKLISISISFGLIKIIELFFALYLGYKYLKLPYEQIQSFIFYILVVSGLFNILNFREERFFFSSKPSKTLILSIILDIFLSSIFVLFGIFLTKLSFFHLLVALLYSFFVTLFLTDIFKIFIYKSKLFRLN
jgi:H+-transporting ATPase